MASRSYFVAIFGHFEPFLKPAPWAAEVRVAPAHGPTAADLRQAACNAYPKSCVFCFLLFFFLFCFFGPLGVGGNPHHHGPDSVFTVPILVNFWQILNQFWPFC